MVSFANYCLLCVAGLLLTVPRFQSDNCTKAMENNDEQYNISRSKMCDERINETGFFAHCIGIQDLSSLSTLDPLVTDLVVSGSKLPILDFRLLPNSSMNLAELTFDGCQIEYIKFGRQPQFLTIRSVSIRNNFIDIIRKDTFQQFPNVVHIDFTFNKVETVHKGAFWNLLKVRTINLSYNILDNVDAKSFYNLPKLETIDPPGILHIISVLDVSSPVHVFWVWLALIFIIALVIFITYLNYRDEHEVAWLTMMFEHLEKIESRVFRNSEYKVGQITFQKQITSNLWQGTLKDHQRAAIKKFEKDSMSSQFKKELDILLSLQRTTTNNHVVRYLCREETKTHLYIALELCDMTLEEAVKTNNENIQPHLTVSSCLQQITDGLKFIHSKGIQHRDIKPSNILLKQEDENIIFVISDFDLGHFLKDVSDHKQRYGTQGWAAPELWIKGQTRTTAVDVFSLGCVFFYVLTFGHHPFGSIDNPKKCQDNICTSTEPPSFVGKLSEHSFEVKLAQDVIGSMIQRTHTLRPGAKWVLKYPIFWNEEDIYMFYHNIGGSEMAGNSTTAFKTMLMANSSEVFTGNWTKNLHKVVRINAQKWNKKPGEQEDIGKLLRYIRNQAEHFGELKREHAEAYDNSKLGVARYFNQMFPNLLLYTFRIKEKSKITSTKKTDRKH